MPIGKQFHTLPHSLWFIWEGRRIVVLYSIAANESDSTLISVLLLFYLPPQISIIKFRKHLGEHLWPNQCGEKWANYQ